MIGGWGDEDKDSGIQELRIEKFRDCWGEVVWEFAG